MERGLTSLGFTVSSYARHRGSIAARTMGLRQKITFYLRSLCRQGFVTEKYVRFYKTGKEMRARLNQEDGVR